jgi:3-oxoacyl-[acyl-carrier-protein] synthase II
MALEDAQVKPGDIPPQRIGVSIGTTMAEAQAIEAIDSIWVNADVSRVSYRLAAQYPGSTIGIHVASEMGCAGPNTIFATACSAGNYAIAHAFDCLRLGKVDTMLAGGSDAFSRIAFMGFNRLLAVAPEKCQPFDKNRKGMMVGEGCGILVLERLEDAVARHAPIYAEILGYGMGCDANHMTIPSVEGVVRVMVSALRDADLKPEDIDYISAHGTGTPANDVTECKAIRSIFGAHTDHIPVSSIKSMLGHTMGAASALEAIACVLAVKGSKVPPTINHETADPECHIDCVPNFYRGLPVRYVLNNSFAFGGNNACSIFGKLVWA